MYQLNIDFTPADLQTILAAGEQVVITKQTGGSNGNVAWIAFSPLGSNTVTWTDTYTMYASRSTLQGGATINMLSQAAALETESLPFNGGFLAADPTIKLSADQYGVENQYNTTPYMVFGLAQSANVSGSAFPASPINATVVPANQSVIFSPLDVIQVFVAANIDNGMVLSNVSSASLTLTFGNGVIEQTVAYNATIGGFQTSSALAARPALRVA